MKNPVVINKVREEWGELGNMARFEIEFEGKVWPRSEQLFQALRFKPGHEELQEQIRVESNPMKAKMVAKRLFKENPEAVYPVCCDEDLVRMKQVLELKFDQHEDIRLSLERTGKRPIVEDCTRRQRGSGLFWGAALQEDGSWKGENALGKLWMVIRQERFGD